MSESLAVAIVRYPGFGGSGIIAQKLAEGLAGRGHDVHVIAQKAAGERHAPAERSGAEHESEEHLGAVTFHEVVAACDPLFENPPYALAVAARIVEVARARPLDLIHVHYAVPHAAAIALARQVMGADGPRVVLTLHGTDVTRTPSQPGYEAINRFAVALADRLSTPSEFLQHEVRRRFAIPGQQAIDVIPNFVDTDHFHPAARRDTSQLASLFSAPAPQEGPFLFHVSNFRKVKRPADLIAILERVREMLPARLIAIGDGPERAATERAANERGLGACVRFLGYQQEFAALLRHADAFVLPSASESFGVAALEAMSSGVPVAAYRVGGLAEVVGTEAGILAEPHDAAELASGLGALLLDEARLATMRNAARDRATGLFGREAALDAYERFYRSVLTSAARKRIA